MQKIVIIGTSCSGKTTLAKTILSRLNIKHIELDEFYWQLNWTARETEDFKNLVVDGIKRVVLLNYTLFNTLKFHKPAAKKIVIYLTNGR